MIYENVRHLYNHFKARGIQALSERADYPEIQYNKCRVIRLLCLVLWETIKR
jgi:hypothetical protein